MIKHIVLFGIKNSDDKKEKCEEIKKALLALTKCIPELIEMEVGINENPEENFDLGLTALFKDLDDLKVYANHPEHLEVVKLVRMVAEKRACIDFSI